MEKRPSTNQKILKEKEKEVRVIKRKYQKLYDEFIKNYKEIHVNPWHEISEEELEGIYTKLISSMDIEDDYTFEYFINFIIKRLSGKTDAHTTSQAIELIPYNFRIFDTEVFINFPNNLKGSKLVSINGVKIENIINELEEIVTYGTPGKRIYELEKALFNKYLIFSIPSLRDKEILQFEIEKLDGTIIFQEVYKNKKYNFEELFKHGEYLFGEPGTYQILDDCLVYKHSSVQTKFKERLLNSINNLRKENLENITKIIIDLRGNLGGNSKLNGILLEFLKEHTDKKIICLTDYRVFSAGRYALRDLLELGAITIGEEIGTPINCYGNSHWLEIDGRGFTISEAYFHPWLKLAVFSQEEFKAINPDILQEQIFKPDIYVEETKNDFILGADPILEKAINQKDLNLK